MKLRLDWNEEEPQKDSAELPQDVSPEPNGNPKGMNLRERLERLVKVGVLVFILAAAAFLSAITTMRIAIRGRIVQMPDVVGQDSRTAQKMLADRGLTMRVADRIYSDVPADRVLRQVPPPGEQVKSQQEAHVVVSLGPRRVSVPLLEGRSLRAARIELLRVGLQAGEISSAYLPDTEPEIVLQQDPKAGSIATTAHVQLLVSQGAPAPAYVMPALLGMSQSDAQGKLLAVGLRVSKITFVPAPEGAHGTVLLQSPPPGVRVAVSSTIELQVAE